MKINQISIMEAKGYGYFQDASIYGNPSYFDKNWQKPYKMKPYVLIELVIRWLNI